MTITTGRPVISAWSAVSGFGIGRAAFSAGLAAGRSAVAEIDQERWEAPTNQAALVPGFDIRTELGRKGTRSMDRATALAVTTVGKLLGDECVPALAESAEQTGLVIGTTTGSAQSIMDFTRDSLVSDKPFFVDPARFPNTVMNCAAGQCAIWYGLRGPNATVAGGTLAGLHALNYASRLLRGGRAETALCGSVEEYSHARAWLEHHGRTDDEHAPLGEGCAMWHVEWDDHVRRERAAGIAEVLTVRFGVFHADEAATTLAQVVRRALDAADVDQDEIWAVSPCRAPGTLGQAEERALADVLGQRQPHRIVPADVLGAASAASAAFQVSAVLSTAERDPASSDRIALVTGVDPEGSVGCALLRLR